MPRAKFEAAALLVLATLGGKVTRNRTAQEARLHHCQSEADDPAVVVSPRPAGANPAEPLHLLLVRATWTMLVDLGGSSPVLLTVGFRLTADDTAGAVGLAVAAVPGVHGQDGVVHFPAGWAHVTAVNPEGGQMVAIVCSVDGRHRAGVSPDAGDWRSVILRPIGFWVTVDKQECKSPPMVGSMGRRAEAALMAATPASGPRAGTARHPGVRRLRPSSEHVQSGAAERDGVDAVGPLSTNPTGDSCGDEPLRAFHSVVHAAWDAFVAA